MGAAAAGFIAGACCAASARACVRGGMGTGRDGSAGARAGESGRRGLGGASEEGVWSEDAGNARFAAVPLGYSHLWRGHSVVERAADRARGDDGGVATHADSADGERVGATRVRTSEADLASLWGRDMTVTRAVPDIQNTGKESTGANVRGALASVGATARVREGPGRRGFRVDGTRRRWPERREDLSRIRAGDGWVHRRGSEKCEPRHRRKDESTNQQSVSHHQSQRSSNLAQQKSRWC